MKCECQVAQFCKRHGVQKTEHWHHLCQTREDYRNLWDAGKGPGQQINRSPPQDISLPYRKWPVWAKGISKLRKEGEYGVGATVKRLTGKTGEKYKALRKRLGSPCGCKNRELEWDKRYPYIRVEEDNVRSTE